MILSEKNRLLKNVIVVSLAFFFEFTAFAGIANLQSTLNDSAALGTTSLAVIYGSLVVSSILLPTVVIKNLGLKYTLMTSLCAYVTYTAANFYPEYYTLVPTAIILGLAGAPLWSAKCAYVTTAAQKYAILTGENEEAVVTKFFGIFFFFFQNTQIFGNLISSLILSDVVKTGISFSPAHNSSYILEYCGSKDCNNIDFNADDSAKTDKSLVYILMGVYTLTGLLSILFIFVFLDDMKMTESESTTDKNNSEALSPWQLCLATIKHFCNDKRQQTIAFITMYSGFKQAFMTGDFTKSFISCPLGIGWIGFILITYGFTDAICSFSMGRLGGKIGKDTSRGFLIGLAIGLDIMACTALLLWVPEPVRDDGRPAWLPFFWIPVFWGVSDAVIQTQINAIYGAFFVDNQDAAFSNYRLWESIGFICPFIYQSLLCTSTKLYIQICVLIVAGFMYLWCEGINKSLYDKKEESLSLKGQSNDAHID